MLPWHNFLGNIFDLRKRSFPNYVVTGLKKKLDSRVTDLHVNGGLKTWRYE